MSEMCCTRLAEKYTTLELRKNRHLGTIAQLCRAMSSHLRHVSTIEKNLLNSIFSTCLHNMVNFSSLTAEIGWRVWAPSKFQRISRLGFITAPTSLNGGQAHFARSLADSWAGTLYIHFWGFLPPGAEFCQVQNSLCVVLCSPILAALLHST